MHLTRRQLIRALGAAGAIVPVGLTLGLAGCAPSQVLSELRPSTNRITPNGGGVGDECKVGFTISRRADVSAWLVGPDGQSHELHAERTMAPDDYEIAFRGIVTTPGSANRRVLPDGKYQLFVRARDESGQAAEQSTTIEIAEADTVAPEIRNLVTSLSEFTPNGDGDEDEVNISYGLSKPAMTTVYVTDKDGRRYLIEAPKKKNAVLVSHIWDGKSGDKVVYDGQYTFTVEAEDTAGNLTIATVPLKVTNAGTPRLEIVEAKFSPIAVPQGGKLNVRFKVKNNGDTHIKTMGPEPGTEYTTNQNFSTFRDPKDANRALYFERPGRWRVGVQWTNAPQLYPVRWGLLKGTDKDDNLSLAPGDEVVIDGTIQILTNDVHEMTFWASIVQEGVGYPGGQVGHTKIKVSF